MWFTSFPFPFNGSAVKPLDLMGRETRSAIAMAQNASSFQKGTLRAI